MLTGSKILRITGMRVDRAHSVGVTNPSLGLRRIELKPGNTINYLQNQGTLLNSTSSVVASLGHWIEMNLNQVANYFDCQPTKGTLMGSLCSAIVVKS
jgi:hypothetical protein